MTLGSIGHIILMILLTILKIIGWILLILLLLILLILLIVCLCPFRYRLQAKVEKKIQTTSGGGEVSWLWGLVRGGAEYKNGKISPYVKILWITKHLGDSEEEKPDPEEEQAVEDLLKEMEEEQRTEAPEGKKPEVVEEQQPEVSEKQQPEVSEKQQPEVSEGQNPEVSEGQNPEVTEEKRPDAKTGSRAEQNPVSDSESLGEDAFEDDSFSDTVSDEMIPDDTVSDDKTSDNKVSTVSSVQSLKEKISAKIAEKKSKKPASGEANPDDHVSMNSEEKNSAPDKADSNTSEEELEKASAQIMSIMEMIQLAFEKLEEADQRLHGAVEKFKAKKQELEEKLLKLKAKADPILEEVKDKKNQKALKHAISEVFGIIHKLLPKEMQADLIYCLGSPDLTGKVYGIFYMIPGAYQNEWRIEPDFETGSFYAEGTVALTGHFRIGSIVAALFRLAIDRNVWHLVKEALKLKKKL